MSPIYAGRKGRLLKIGTSRSALVAQIRQQLPFVSPATLPSGSVDKALAELTGERVIAVSPVLVHAFGPAAAILLAQCLYWQTGARAQAAASQSYSRSKKSWFYNTREEMRQQTGLTEGGLETARKKLMQLGVLKCGVEGIPPVTYWRVRKRLLLGILRHVLSTPACTTSNSAKTTETNTVDSTETFPRKPSTTLIVRANSPTKTPEISGVLTTPFYSRKKNGERNSKTSRKYSSLTERFSDEQLASQCCELAANGDPAEFPEAAVDSFINSSICNRWTVRGDPIYDLRSALKSWCAKYLQVRDVRQRETLPGSGPCGLSEFAERCWQVFGEYDVDPGHVDIFINEMERTGGQAVNPATGQLEPVRDVKAALLAFCEKAENDRSGF